MRPTACIHTSNHFWYACACTHTLTLLVLTFWGILCTGDPAKICLHKHNVICQCCPSQWQSAAGHLRKAITGLYTFPPVSPAFCLSADAVKPSIFSPSFTCFRFPSVPPTSLAYPSLYLSLIYYIQSCPVLPSISHVLILFNVCLFVRGVTDESFPAQSCYCV